jgi:ABC-2 type transport system permease protein
MMKTILFTGVILKRYLKKKRLLFMMLLMPLLTAVMIGSVYQPVADGAIPIAWVDEDASEASRYLTKLMQEESLLRLMITNRTQAIHLTRRYRVEGTYIIPAGFEEQLQRDRIPQMELIRSAASFGADTIAELIASGVIRLASHHRAASIILNEYRLADIDVDETVMRRKIIKHADTYWEDGPVIPLRVNESLIGDAASRETQRGILAGPHGALTAFITLFAVSIPLLISQEKKSGMWQRILMATGSESVFRRSYIISYTFIQMIIAFVVIAIMTMGFHVQTVIPPILLVTVLTAYAFFLAAFFSWIAQWSPAADYSGSLTFLVMLLCLISGCFWTYDIYPVMVRRLLLLSPPGFFMQLVRQYEIRNNTVAAAGTFLMLILGIFLTAQPYSFNKKSSVAGAEDTM